MDKEQIVSTLKLLSGNSKVQLPRDVGIVLDKSVLNVTITKPCCNMQSNNSSFEGWILTLCRWLSDKIEGVSFDWDSPNLTLTDNDRLHYNRFLFRVYMFSKMYPAGFFILNGTKKNEVNNFIAPLRTGRVLNRPTTKATDCSGRDSECGVESLFVGQYGDLLKQKTNVTYLYNQLPVGVFEKTVEKKNAIFTGGKSAIDLWGVNLETRTLSVYELKYKKNIMVGVLSELFFYLMILNEACGKEKPWFTFDDKKSRNDGRGIDKLEQGKPFSEIRGFILADAMHPLIDSQVIKLFNEGLARIGNIKVDTLLYHYNHDSKVLEWQP